MTQVDAKCGTFALLLLLAALPVFAQPGPTERERELVEIARSFAATSSVQTWLTDNRADLDANVLEELDSLAIRASQVGALGLAHTIRWLLATAAMDTGNLREAMQQRLYGVDLEFNIAADAAAYTVAREGAHQIAQMAVGQGDNDLAFEARVIAADSSYFAMLLEGLEHAETQRWQSHLLDDIVEATRVASAAEPDGIWLERFASLTTVILQEAGSRMFFGGDEDRRQSALAKLAPTLEALIPVDFEYIEIPGKDAEQAEALAVQLAQLSYDLGDARQASARLKHVANAALGRGDLERWASVTYRQYRGEKARDAEPARLGMLRGSLRDTMVDLRARSRSRAGRLWAASHAQQMFGELLRDELLASRVSPAKAFKEIERLKARYLLDQMLARSVPLPAAAIRDRAAAIEAQVLGFPDCSHISQGLGMREAFLLSHVPIGSLMPREDQIKQIGALEHLYAEAEAGFRDVAEVASLEQVRRALAPGEAILEYFIPYHDLHPAMDLWVLAIAKDDVRLVHIPIGELLQPPSGMIGRIAVDGCPPMDSSPLGEAIFALRLALQRSDEKRATQMLEAFYQLLIAPLEEAGFAPGAYERVTIVPHGPLHYLPFAALRGKSGFMIEQVAVTMSPSASVWFAQQAVRRPWPGSGVGLFAPDLVATELPPLPTPADEMRALQTLLPESTRIFEGNAAKETAFHRFAPGAEILHISTHGAFPQANAIDFHRVLLGAGDKHDGRLQAQEVGATDLSKAALVVLAVCNGGLYTSGPSDEPYGLIPAFIDAGADTVVGTLWPLEDTFGRDFVSEFYTNLNEDGVAEALRQTAISYIGDEELIRRWAGFVSVGPARPFVTIRPENSSRSPGN